MTEITCRWIKIRANLVILASVIITACGGGFSSGPRPASPGSVSAGANLNVSPSMIETIAGRPFLLTLISFDHSNGSGGKDTSTVLSIEGDSLAISFGSSTAPFTVQVLGDVIEFGGHRLAITQTPGNYVVDSTPIQLGATILHVFYDGRYIGPRGYLGK